MKSIELVTSEGQDGPVYVRFSREKVASTDPTEVEDEVVVDYDAAGQVVGIELVSICPETIAAFVDAARQHDLDIRALFARTFAVPSAA